MDGLKKRKLARADEVLNPKVNKDDNIDNEDDGIADSVFAQ